MQTSGESARQGKRGRRVVVVLAISLLLCLVALGIFELFYGLT